METNTTECEVICEDTYSHVCASNGKTFHNLCFLQKVSFYLALEKYLNLLSVLL